MEPKFTLEKIKFVTDPETFCRAVEIYGNDKETGFGFEDPLVEMLV